MCLPLRPSQFTSGRKDGLSLSPSQAHALPAPGPLPPSSAVDTRAKPSRCETDFFISAAPLATEGGAPLVGVSEIPDSFFSEPDIEVRRRRVSLDGPLNGPLDGLFDERASAPPASQAKARQPPHDFMRPVQDRPHEHFLEASKAPSAVVAPPPAMSPRQECVVPQASRADLMGEKGRISMEICDIMELLEGPGAKDPQLQAKLLRFRQRRKEIDQLLASGHAASAVASQSRPVGSAPLPTAAPATAAPATATPTAARAPEKQIAPHAAETSEWARDGFAWTRDIKKAMKQ